MSRLILGVDIGRTGGLALLTDDGELLNAIDIPVRSGRTGL